MRPSSITSLPETRSLAEAVRGQRILFAEDDLGLRSVVTEFLSAEGFEVTTVGSGDQAAIVLETEQFDLLLTDVRMPGTKDGIDLAEHAWKRDPGLPVVVISGYAEQLGARLAELGRGVKFLRKPFRLNEFLTTITAAARSRESSPAKIKPASPYGFAAGPLQALSNLVDLRID